MSLFEDSKAKQRPVALNTDRVERKGLQLHFLLVFPRAAQRSILQDEEVCLHCGTVHAKAEQADVRLSTSLWHDHTEV